MAKCRNAWQHVKISFRKLLEGTRAGEETAESALRLDQRKERELFIHSLLCTDGSILGSLIVRPMAECSTAVLMEAGQDDILERHTSAGESAK